MDVLILGANDTTRSVIGALLREGAVSRLGIVTNKPPEDVLYFLTTTWTGERSRLDGRIDGSDLIIRGRYSRGGLREDTIATRRFDSKDLGEFAASYDCCVDLLSSDDDKAPVAEVVGKEGHPRLISWAPVAELYEASWPWALDRGALNSASIKLAPSDVAVGVAALKVAARLGDVTTGGLVSCRPARTQNWADEVAPGANVLNVTWDAQRDFAQIGLPLEGENVSANFARIESPVMRGGAVIAMWDWADRPESMDFGRALRHAMRGELQGILGIVDHASESSAAFDGRVMGAVARRSIVIRESKGTCAIATSSGHAESIQLVKLLAAIEGV